jgi:hypothetical protein
LTVLLALQDVGDHYAHPRGRWTWSMKYNRRYRQSKTDYILAQELSDFKRWAIKFPRVHTGHCAIIAEMTTDRFYIHKRYTTC